MLILIIILAIILFLIIFVIAPAVVCYRSVFGRRKVLPLDDDRLYKPAIEPYKARMLSDLSYLKEQGGERVTVRAFDGVTLCGDYYHQGADKTAVMVHGYNADPYVNLVCPARWLYDFGFNVLVITHRAHGDSGGKRGGMGLIEKNDVMTWVNCVLRKDPSQRILLYGSSMGGSALMYLSDTIDESRVLCMVDDCGYISAENQLKSDARRMHLPTVLIPLICRIAKRDQHIDIRERTVDHLRHAKKPILFIHGTADRTVALEEGQANFDACTSEKRMVIVENAAHTTAFQTDEEKVGRALADFIDAYFNP